MGGRKKTICSSLALRYSPIRSLPRIFRLIDSVIIAVAPGDEEYAATHSPRSASGRSRASSRAGKSARTSVGNCLEFAKDAEVVVVHDGPARS